MKKLNLISLVILISFITPIGLMAQSLTLPPSGDNQKSIVTQYIGPVKVSIKYNSPDVHTSKGEDRTGKIWGKLVPYGFTDPGFGTSKSAPWRAGANENTVIYLSHDVEINGRPLKAGKYGLFLVVEKDKPWTWIFSKNYSSWGAYFYTEKEDALRVEASPGQASFTEYLTFGFSERKSSSAVAYLKWENKKVDFTVTVPTLNDIYIASIRKELRGSAGFTSRNWVAATNFCLNKKVNLDEALTWADAAINAPYVGKKNFTTLSTKARVLDALDQSEKSEALMKEAIAHPTASVTDLHQYGRQLLKEKKNKKAFEIFQLNAKKNPQDKFTPNVGLGRGYAAIGNKKKAIEYWEKALANIPENQKPYLSYYQDIVKKLKE